MREIKESKDTYYGIGEGLYINYWNGIFSISKRVTEGTPMKPFVQFKLKSSKNYK